MSSPQAAKPAKPARQLPRPLEDCLPPPDFVFTRVRQENSHPAPLVLPIPDPAGFIPHDRRFPTAMVCNKRSKIALEKAFQKCLGRFKTLIDQACLVGLTQLDCTTDQVKRNMFPPTFGPGRKKMLMTRVRRFLQKQHFSVTCSSNGLGGIIRTLSWTNAGCTTPQQDHSPPKVPAAPRKRPRHFVCTASSPAPPSPKRARQNSPSFSETSGEEESEGEIEE